MIDSLDPLRAHPAFRALADNLAEYVGIERDLIQFIEFISLCAGRMVMPINLDILSDNITVDLHVANRVLDLRSGHIARVDTHREFRALERSRFLIKQSQSGRDGSGDTPHPRPVSAILLRGNHRILHRDITEYTARLVQGDEALPSIWRVSDLASSLSPVPSTLRIQTSQTGRDLLEFGGSFAAHRPGRHGDTLAKLIDSLPDKPKLACSFRKDFQGNAAPELLMVFERVLCVLAVIRENLLKSTERPRHILREDYAAGRSLLVSLPLTPIDRQLSPNALNTAEQLHKRLRLPDVGIELPDLSVYGPKWFTRGNAMDWTDLSYNTVKKHLRQLEEEGLLRSTVAQNNREQGRQIHFQFVDNRAPPFAWKNPFEGLPQLAPPR
jgi:DNA-binding transcriptional ArsR family regulator